MLPITDLPARPNTTHPPLPTLVLLHFFGGSRREWIETGLLLARNFRVISIDTPGFGEAAAVQDYSVAAMADVFADTLTQLNLASFILVGHSMTGKVAAVLADRGLPGLKKLVLLTPSPLSPEPIADSDRAEMLAQSNPTRQDAENYIRSNSRLPIPDNIFNRAVEDRLRAEPAAWRAWLEQGSQEDWSDRINRLTLPTLVIAGEQDKSLGPAVQQNLTLPHFAHAQLEVVKNSGHLVPMEAPDTLARLISGFAGK